MSSELIRVVRCDRCGRDKATEHTLTLDGATWGIDLCPEDSEPLEALQALLEAHGRAERGVAMSRRAMPHFPGGVEPGWHLLGRTCVLCEYVGPSRAALGQHVDKAHQKMLSEAEDNAGRFYACDQCSSQFPRYMGVTQHQRSHRAAA